MSTPSGPVLAIGKTRSVDCDEEPCGQKTIEVADIIRLEDGQLVIEEDRPAADLQNFTKFDIEIIGRPPSPSFPYPRPEGEHWHSVVSAIQPSSSVTRSLPALDFSLVEDGERYATILQEEEFGSVRVTSDGTAQATWLLAPAGKFLMQYLGCQFDHKGIVKTCQIWPVTAMHAHPIESADQRYVALRNCGSIDEALQVLDMLHLEKRNIKMPQDHVVGFAIDAKSQRLAALTERNDLLLYSLDGDTAPSLLGTVGLPGGFGVSSVKDCDQGRPMQFIGSLVIGLDGDGRLFAVDTVTMRTRWLAENADASWAKAGQISASANGALFSLQSKETFQLFDASSGLPLTDRFDPATLMDEAPGEDWRDHFGKAHIDDSGRVSIPCSSHSNYCTGRLFIREAPPAPIFSGCRRIELLTGKDHAGERLDVSTLINYARQSGPCAKSP